MRRLTLTIAAGLLISAGTVGAAGSGVGGSSASPALRVVDRTPLTVQGRHFGSRERVKLTLSKGQATVLSRRVTTNAGGLFSATLPETGVDRCDQIMIRAVGSRGARAQLKIMRPACHAT